MQATTTFEALAQEIRGEVIVPDDPGYEAARRVWNAMVDMRPAVIVRAQGAIDVVAVVDFARETGLELAVRGGGHSSPGLSSSEGGIVLDLSRMKGVWVDATEKRMRAQAGALWGDVDRETQAFGLAVPGGQVSHTGIAGLTLGGGIGWLSRLHGLTIDSLLSVDLVTADGRLVTASEHEHPDLFWGLRGGSGNFGVVVSFEYRLHEVGPIVLGGPLFYPLDEAAAVMRNVRDVMEGASDELALFMGVVHVPPVAPFPEQHWGERSFMLAPFCVDLERGPDLIAPLTAVGTPIVNLHGPIPYAVLQTAIDESTRHGDRYWDRGDYLHGLTDGAIEAVLEGARAMTSPQHEILLFPLGGAIARVDADATAFGDRTAPWATWTIAHWVEPAEDAEHRAWARAVSQSLTPWATGGAYVNSLDADDEQRKVAAYGGHAKFERLRSLKREWDPANLFRRNHNIEP